MACMVDSWFFVDEGRGDDVCRRERAGTGHAALVVPSAWQTSTPVTGV